MAFELTSSAFVEDERIPRIYTCEGQDISPPLPWSGAPSEIRSFALLCDDPDSPAGVWRQWAAYDIPAERAGLPEGVATETRVGNVRQAINDFGRAGYGGPCPPLGHGIHHYHFRLLALDVGTLGLDEGVRCAEVGNAAAAHVLAEAELMGTYSR